VAVDKHKISFHPQRFADGSQILPAFSKVCSLKINNGRINNLWSGKMALVIPQNQIKM